MKAIPGDRILMISGSESGMRSRSKLAAAAFLAVLPCVAGTFVVPATAPGPWPAILSASGHAPAALAATADIVVAPLNAAASADYRSKVMNGAALILEGSSPLASSFGFVAGSATV